MAKRNGSPVGARPLRPAELPIRENDVLFDSKGRAYRLSRLGTAPAEDRHRDGIVTASLLPLGPSEHGFGSDKRLTPRETQVARLLACRATNAEIVSSLGMSSHTARNHTRRVLEKLGLTSRAEVREQCIAGQTPMNEGKGSSPGYRARKAGPALPENSP